MSKLAFADEGVIDVLEMLMMSLYGYLRFCLLDLDVVLPQVIAPLFIFLAGFLAGLGLLVISDHYLLDYVFDNDALLIDIDDLFLAS